MLKKSIGSFYLALFFFTLVGCSQENPAKKAIDTLDGRPRSVCLLEREPLNSKPSPQLPPVVTIADDIHMSYNCSEELGIEWDKVLRGQNLLLNGKVVVYGSSTSCKAEDSIPMLSYVDDIDPKLKESIDTYNEAVQKKLIQSNETLTAAIQSAKNCSFPKQGDLLRILSAQGKSLRLDTGSAADRSPEIPNYKELSSQVLLDELACLGRLSLQDAYPNELAKTYAKLKTQLSKTRRR